MEKNITINIKFTIEKILSTSNAVLFIEPKNINTSVVKII